MPSDNALRGFQAAVQQGCYDAWKAGHKVVMPVIPTGGGKTKLMADTVANFDGCGLVAAHRNELNMQLSMALAQEGVRHDIIASKETIRAIVKKQIDEIGKTYYDPRSDWKVAAVDTIIRRDLDERWRRKVGAVFQDEGHHVLKYNKWGRVFGLFPNALGFFPTASPMRADCKGLGRHASGLVDVMVEGPSMRWMIDNGYLVGYQVRAPHPSDFDMTGVDISPVTGDYNLDQMRKRVKESKAIIGDVVRTYLDFARGKLGITFAVDIEHATWIADAYNRAGVPAQVVSSQTSDADRDKFMRQFRNRELLQLVNVDLFGEGVDVPALEVVSMARPTASYSLYMQQFGRALRLSISKLQAQMWDSFSVTDRLAQIAASSKPVAIILDHVGNVISHFGPPDYRKIPWTLDDVDRKSRNTDGLLLRACINPVCLMTYERYHIQCPFCGQLPPVPADRSRPEYVDGDVILYTPELLERLFGEQQKVDGPCYTPQGVEPMVRAAIRNRHQERQEAQGALRQTMGLVLPPNVDSRQNDKRFFLTYGIDTLTAKTLGSAEATKLKQRIIEKVTAK